MTREYKTRAKLMGSAFEFILSAKNPQEGESLLKECISEVQRLERLLTEFSEDSDTGRLNRNAGGKAVEVSPETYELLRRSMYLSDLTQGAFDITTGVLKKLYNFKGESFQIPSKAEIGEAKARSGYQKIQLLDQCRVRLTVKGMHIGFGAIGKGYAADRVRRLMQQKGVPGGVINASGDLSAWGLRPDGQRWKAGIANPQNPDEPILWLPILEGAVATSGNYEQYFEWKGERYSHNIDPKSGLPVKGVQSVSVIGPSAELCDALATAVTIMGPAAGLHLINQLPATHCILVDQRNHMHYSKKIQLHHAA